MEQSDTLKRIWETLTHIEELLSEQRTAKKSGCNLLSPEEVAEYTGYTKRYVYKLAQEKQIPHYKRGARLFFRKDEIDQWLLENRVITNDEIERAAIGYCRGKHTTN